MSAFETADDILAGHCSELLDDVPKIDSALKNLIAMCMANVQASSDRASESDAHLQIMGAARYLHSCISPLLPLDNRLYCRAILKEINSHRLVSPAQWGLEHPQEDLPALDRLSSISKYKSAVYLLSKISSQNMKVSKCFGRKYLDATQLWPAIYQKLSATPEASGEIFSSFITQFHNSMTSPGSSKHSPSVSLYYYIYINSINFLIPASHRHHRGSGMCGSDLVFRHDSRTSRSTAGACEDGSGADGGLPTGSPRLYYL